MAVIFLNSRLNTFTHVFEFFTRKEQVKSEISFIVNTEVKSSKTYSVHSTMVSRGSLLMPIPEG